MPSIITQQIAKHLKEVLFGGNWTASNLKDQLQDVTWQEATQKIHEFNSIATLVQHSTYYITEVSKVLDAEPLLAKDELSFKHPEFNNEDDWQRFLSKIWVEAEKFIIKIEALKDEVLTNDFTAKKYGIYYRNLSGITEHLHYHLGQIVIIKKLIRLKK